MLWQCSSEAIQAEKDKAAYEKKHAAGETEEARADLARLAIIRKQREDQRVKREALGQLGVSLVARRHCRRKPVKALDSMC